MEFQAPVDCAATDNTEGVCASNDESQLLQKMRKHQVEDWLGGFSKGPDTQKQSMSAAVAFEGGGFKSLTIMTGLVTGFLNALGPQKGKTPSMESSGLFDRFGMLTSTSGGTWFVFSLAYSQRNQDLYEKMAASPERAGDIYNEEFITPLLARNGSKCDLFKLYMNCLGPGSLLQTSAANQTADPSELERMYPWLQDLKILLHTVCDGSLTWTNFVATLLRKTASIDSKAVLGDTVNPWAKGKLSLVTSSLATWGISSGLGQNMSPDAVSIFAKGALFPIELSAHTSTSADFPAYLPVKFSRVLGPDEPQVPLPFCYGEFCSSIVHNYVHTSKFLFATLESTAASTAPLAEGFAAAFADISRLPLVSVLSSSSATMGASALKDSVMRKIESNCLRLVPWISSEPNGNSFSKADLLLRRVHSSGYDPSMVNDLAAGNVLPLVDGGQTDNTAVSHAVANGATDIVSFLQWAGDLANLFTGGPRAWPPTPSLSFHIFEESVDEVNKQIMGTDSLTGKAFEKLMIPSNSNGYLTNFTFGTIHATTVDQEVFNITKGIRVNITAFFPNVSLGIGGGENLYNYGHAVGDIVAAMTHPDNGALVAKMVNIMIR